jgi:hypothetical protein
VAGELVEPEAVRREHLGRIGRQTDTGTAPHDDRLIT